MVNAATRGIAGRGCAFCGLACDDVEIARHPDGLAVVDHGCLRAAEGFRHWSEPLASGVAGRPVAFEAALEAAGRWLAKAERPLFAGLVADVDAQRAMVALADRTGGVVDHAGGIAQWCNQSVFQDTGLMAATLAEVRVRADVLVLVGDRTVRGFPRLLERLGAPPGRVLICLGWTPGPDDLAGWTGPAPCVVEGRPEALPEIVAALRTLAAGGRLAREAVGGANRAALDELALRLRNARYGVIAWAAEGFGFAGAELAVFQLVELVRDLNRKTRCAALPLGGSGNGAGAHQVMLWQTGFGLRTRFTPDGPHWEPHHQAWERLLAAGEVDLLVWLATLGGPAVPAPDGVPVIALVAPGTRFAGVPAVVLAVGRPGIDHDAHVFRTDGVVALPLHAGLSGAAPPAAAVLAALADLVGEGRHALQA